MAEQVDDGQAFVPLMDRNERVQDARIPVPDAAREPEIYAAAQELPPNRYDLAEKRVMPVVMLAAFVALITAGVLHLWPLGFVAFCVMCGSAVAGMALAQSGAEARATEVVRQREKDASL